MNKTIESEKQLLESVIEKFTQLTGKLLEVNFTEKKKKEKGYTFDVELILNENTHQEIFSTEIKKNLSSSALKFLLYTLPAHTPENHKPLLIADYINPVQADKLKDAGIYYLDLAGNAWLKTENLFVLIMGQKPAEFRHSKPKRAFHEAGIKIIYKLFVQPELLNASHRDLSSAAQVSLGSVSYVLQDLLELGYLAELEKGHLIIQNPKRLLDRWLEAYHEKLRPKLNPQRYKALDETRWKKWQSFQLDKIDSYWGGEPAGDLYTNYLNPEVFTIYTHLKRSEIMSVLRVLPNKQGNIEILDAFWKPEHRHFNLDDQIQIWDENKTSAKIVSKASAVLAYTDLMLSAKSRNQETAQRIYEQYLSDFFEGK